MHPDPDSLNAFLEGVLPEHERLQCLSHLAECARCREVVFQANEPQKVPATFNPVPARRLWFAPMPVLAAAAAACIAVFGVSLYLHRTVKAPIPDVVARERGATPAPAPHSADIQPETAVPSLPAPGVLAQHPAVTAHIPNVSVPAAVLASAGKTVSATPQSSAEPGNAQGQTPPLPVKVSSVPPPVNSTTVEPKEPLTLADGLSGISGTVTDPSGATIPAATVTLRQLAGTFSRDIQTDSTGQFKLGGLPTGRYELQITAPGFRQTLKQVDLQPREWAAVSSELMLGSVSETVQVMTEATVLETSSSTTERRSRRKAASPPEPGPLPNKRPATVTVTSGKTMLAMDSDGELFVSRNLGKRWKAVKAAWSGKVAHLIALTEPSQTQSAKFQIATDTDSVWLSRDGTHWYPASPVR